MEFGRRDVLLVAGLVLFMIGLIPFMAPVYAAVVVIAMYFGIKVFVARRNQAIHSELGPEGICMECGGRISGGRCPDCDGSGAGQSA
ncbi:MAG: hypothetical protein OXP12_01705 [Thaumarchaeota archaeon]|nr:hypothetical protein [Nitrososphaerota archaeon]MDE0265781.1 hypothetical protein [Nitrososphaerota archaeon]